LEQSDFNNSDTQIKEKPPELSSSTPKKKKKTRGRPFNEEREVARLKCIIEFYFKNYENPDCHKISAFLKYLNQIFKSNEWKPETQSNFDNYRRRNRSLFEDLLGESKKTECNYEGKPCMCRSSMETFFKKEEKKKKEKEEKEEKKKLGPHFMNEDFEIAVRKKVCEKLESQSINNGNFYRTAVNLFKKVAKTVSAEANSGKKDYPNLKTWPYKALDRLIKQVNRFANHSFDLKTMSNNEEWSKFCSICKNLSLVRSIESLCHLFILSTS